MSHTFSVFTQTDYLLYHNDLQIESLVMNTWPVCQSWCWPTNKICPNVWVCERSSQCFSILRCISDGENFWWCRCALWRAKALTRASVGLSMLSNKIVLSVCHERMIDCWLCDRQQIRSTLIWCHSRSSWMWLRCLANWCTSTVHCWLIIYNCGYMRHLLDIYIYEDEDFI